MKRDSIKKLCCPLCKEELELQIESEINKNITEGNMFCNGCRKEYLIKDGIPRMYIPDAEIITHSKKSKHSDFVVTSENLDRWIKSGKSIRSPNFLKKIPTSFSVGFGWILFFITILMLFIYYLNFNIIVTKITHNISIKLPLLAISLATLFLSITLFSIDYFRYRTIKKRTFLNDLKKIKELYDKSMLSEYDIRISRKDEENVFKDQVDRQSDFVVYKGEKIESLLKKYDFKVETALNIGCGGELHKSVSIPYFNKGYHMWGIDINEQYLTEFSQIFNTEVALANSLALPLKSNCFNLVNFTDILEHCHHPLLGLSEAQRVLREDGVIILTTENQCNYRLNLNPFYFFELNPIIFFEKVISLYYDKVLPPRTIIAEWMGFHFYHTQFSKNKVISLMEDAGFEILSFETQFPAKNSEKLNKIYKKFPVLKYMGVEIMIIAKKKNSTV